MLIKVILHHPVKFHVNLSESSPLSLIVNFWIPYSHERRKVPQCYHIKFPLWYSMVFPSNQYNLKWQHQCVQKISIVKIFNATYRRKLFHSIEYKNAWLATSDLFYMFTQSVKFIYHILKSSDVWKIWFIKLTVKIMVPSFSKFYSKIWVAFCFKTGKRIFIQVSF